MSAIDLEAAYPRDRRQECRAGPSILSLGRRGGGRGGHVRRNPSARTMARFMLVPGRARLSGKGENMDSLVLIVDDDRSIAHLMMEVLHARGLRVVSARTAQEGLELARELKPSLILMDLRMRGENGCAATMRIRNDPALASTPVVLVSACSPETLEILAGESGANDILTKPFGLERLVSVVRKWIENGTP